MTAEKDKPFKSRATLFCEIESLRRRLAAAEAELTRMLLLDFISPQVTVTYRDEAPSDD